MWPAAPRDLRRGSVTSGGGHQPRQCCSGGGRRLAGRGVQRHHRFARERRPLSDRWRPARQRRFQDALGYRGQRSHRLWVIPPGCAQLCHRRAGAQLDRQADEQVLAQAGSRACAAAGGCSTAHRDPGSLEGPAAHQFGAGRASARGLIPVCACPARCGQAHASDYPRRSVRLRGNLMRGGRFGAPRIRRVSPPFALTERAC